MMTWMIIVGWYFSFGALFYTYSRIAVGADYAIAIARAILYSLLTYVVTEIYSPDTNWLVRLLWVARGAAFLGLTSWIIACIAFFVAGEIASTIHSNGGYRVKFALLLIEPLYVLWQNLLTAAIAVQYAWGLWLFAKEAWISIDAIPYFGRFVLVVPVLDLLAYQMVVLRYVLEPIVVLSIGLKDLFAIVTPYILGRSTRTFLDQTTLRPEYSKEIKSQAAVLYRTILAFSDTHMASKDGYIHGNPVGRTSAHTKQFIVETMQATPADAIVHCGDVTDAGDYFAWNTAAEAFDRKNAFYDSKKTPFFAVPGNHDINLARITARDDLFGSLENRTQDEHAVKRLSAMMGPLQLDDDPYPVVYRDDKLSLIVVLFDSTKRVPMTPFSNALGLVGSEQLRKAETLVKNKRRAACP